MTDPRRNSTVDQLRHDIDRGRTGDKVDFPDPSAAPLGTDEEAAGAPVAPRAVEMARSQELKGPNRKSGTGRKAFAPAAVGAALLGLLGLLVAWFLLTGG